MLCRFALPDEDHWNIPPVALLQGSIPIHVHFVEGSIKLAQEWCDGSLRFVAKMAARPSVEGNVARARGGKAGVFGMLAHRFAAKWHLTGEQAPMGRTAHNNKPIV